MTLAGNEVQKNVLQQEFPELPCLPLKGYQVRYSKRAWSLPWQMLVQIPSILRSIRREHKWLKRIQTEQRFDLVISDNRYGLYAKKIPSVILTHQTCIQIPQSKWLEKKVSELTQKMLGRFEEVWIPDYTDHRLSGALSENLLRQVRYLGNLSRFDNQYFKSEYIKYLFILSGPEPQRSLLENLILKLEIPGQKVVMLRGKPGQANKIQKPNWIILNHCNSLEMREYLKQAKIVICRSGYSSLMDLSALGKKALLIPTPGQTEQEYLAHFFASQGRANVVNQERLLSEFDEAVRAIELLPDIAPEQPILEEKLNDFFQNL